MTDQRKSVVIGTAGHIDHGKTTLVRALTGIDTDRLPEEKRRGITIDLGFASLETIGVDSSPLQLSFIDVPGHHMFIRNMLAGIGGIDAVMLVISAEEGVKPQTEEHLAICEMLGVRIGLTAITKIDAVSAVRLEEVERSIRQFLSGTVLGRQTMPVISVSAKSGLGLDELQSELVSLAARVPARVSDCLPRLPIDRAFVMKGFGAVVTGTLLAGSLANGQSLVIEPGSRAVRVRGIHIHGQSEESAYAGSRVALNLAGVAAIDVHRGDTLLEPSTLSTADTIDVEVTLLPKVKELKHRSRIHFHAFASESIATVSLYGNHVAEAGSTRLMRLRLDKPVVLVPGDRFVLRQLSPPATIGGGRILDARPILHLRKAASLKWLQDLKGASLDQQILMRVARCGTMGLELSTLSAETGLATEALDSHVRTHVSTGKLVRVSSNLLLTRVALENCLSIVQRDFESRVKTLQGSGLKRSELKSHTRLSGEVFDFILEKLQREHKLQVRGELIFPFGVEEKSQDQDRELLNAIASTFESAGLSSPSIQDVADQLSIDSREMRRLITLLLREKTLIKLGNEEIFMHQLALARLRSQLASRRGQTVDVAQFKQLTGLSRKYAIPLLEYLDRERVTRKAGDHRLVL